MKKFRITTIISIAALITALLSTVAFAHPGSLDSKGGHWNHSTGEYHYHDGNSTSSGSGSNSSKSYSYEYFNKSTSDSDRTGSSSSYSHYDKNEPRDEHLMSDLVISCIVGALFVAFWVCITTFSDAERNQRPLILAGSLAVGAVLGFIVHYFGRILGSIVMVVCLIGIVGFVIWLIIVSIHSMFP